MTAQIRVMPAPPLDRFAIEVMDPGEDRFTPYIRGTREQIDEILSELQPEDGVLVSDCRKAA